MVKRIIAMALLAALFVQIPRPAAAASGYAWGARFGRAILELIGAHDIARQHREEQAKKERAATRAKPQGKSATAPKKPPTKLKSEQQAAPYPTVRLAPVSPWLYLLPVPIAVGVLMRMLRPWPVPLMR